MAPIMGLIAGMAVLRDIGPDPGVTAGTHPIMAGFPAAAGNRGYGWGREAHGGRAAGGKVWDFDRARVEQKPRRASGGAELAGREGSMRRRVVAFGLASR